MKNHHQKEYRLVRAVALWLQNNVCYNCSEKCLNAETHHLDHDSLCNELRNIAVMCPSCHKLFHRIPKQPLIPLKKIVVWLLKKVEIYSK